METRQPSFAGSATRRFAASGRQHSSSRETVLRLLESRTAPVTITELAALLDLHENTLRGHVEALWEDGYVTRSRADSRGQGRPPWLWSATNTDPAAPYAELAAVLAETLARTSADPTADARAAGRAWGHRFADRETSAASPEAAVVAAMTDMGFAPELRDDSTVVLHRCPLIAAASQQPDVVCAVHHGLVDAVLQASGADRPDTTLTRFTAPDECTLRLRARR